MRLARFATTLALFVTLPLAAGALAADDIVVSDVGAAGGALFLVDAETGARTVLSGCADSSCSSLVGAGPGLVSPDSIAFEDDGSVLVTERDFPSLLRVDPDSGHRDVVSGCSAPGCGGVVGSGTSFGDPIGVAVQSDGTILVADRITPNMAPSRIVAVDPTSGDRSVLSGCPDTGCAAPVGTGPLPDFADSLALESDGDVLVTLGAGSDVLRIEPGTGNRTFATGGTGPSLTQPRALVVAPNHEFFVVSLRAVYQVDLAGNRAVFSGCLDGGCTTEAGSGPSFQIPLGVARTFEGTLLIADAFPAALFEVDTLGNRIRLSGCEDPGCTSEVGSGESFRLLNRVAVVDTPEVSVFDFEGDSVGAAPGGVVGTSGNVAVYDGSFFPDIPNPATSGFQFVFASSGPGSTGAGSSGQDLTGDGNDESDVASLFLVFQRDATDPPDLAFDFDVLTAEGSIPDPFAVWLDATLLASGGVLQANGSFPALTGFTDATVTGPDGEFLSRGRVGYRTVRVTDLAEGVHVLHFFVADDLDDAVDTALLVDHVRYAPEIGRSLGLGGGSLLLLAVGAFRRPRRDIRRLRQNE